MTIEEVEHMIKSARSVQRQVVCLQNRIEEVRMLFGSVRSPTIGAPVQGGEKITQQEYVYYKLEELYKRYGNALDSLCDMQRQLDSALKSLDPIEREILSGVIDGKTYAQIGDMVGYSDSTIKRKKRVALKKIAENTKVDPP